MVGPRTIRAKLTLMTAFVMGAILSILGGLVDAGARESLLGGIDQDLKRQGMDAVQGHINAMHRFGGVDMFRMPFRPPPPAPFRTLRPRFFRIHSQMPLPDTNEAPFSLEAIADARQGRSTYRTVEVENQPVRVFTVPLYEGKIVGAAVQIPFDLTDTYRALDNLRRILLLMIPVGVAVSVLAGFFIIDRLMRPLRMITQDADAIGTGSLTERLPVVGHDEFAYLGSTLNKMLDRLLQAFELEQQTTRRLQENLKQQRRFTADASHELKTPLAVIKANTSLVLIDKTTASQKEGLEAIDDAADRMNRLVSGLLQLARSESGKRQATIEPCLLGEVARRAIRSVPPTDGILIQLCVEDESATIPGQFDDLVRLFQNLVDNAIRHSGGSEIVVAVGPSEIEVRDNGCGISAEHLEHLFDRFYRVDESRTVGTGGTGLGLAICKSIAEANGGVISVESAPGAGTRFLVQFKAPEVL